MIPNKSTPTLPAPRTPLRSDSSWLPLMVSDHKYCLSLRCTLVPNPHHRHHHPRKPSTLRTHITRFASVSADCQYVFPALNSWIGKKRGHKSYLSFRGGSGSGSFLLLVCKSLFFSLYPLLYLHLGKPGCRHLHPPPPPPPHHCHQTTTRELQERADLISFRLGKPPRSLPLNPSTPQRAFLL
jgi:hypothetical protein